eukprot:TRINITY_DN7126_c0_g2_i1.p1 TRINITY_DN7126_c0_g2~~TRINITY_DN7126_c0_g2_i1.p1  ORF type:complete len:660 (+),score=104.92 TRINITY_DN7126_c0_g2_i1:226-2205(+)
MRLPFCKESCATFKNRRSGRVSNKASGLTVLIVVICLTAFNPIVSASASSSASTSNGKGDSLRFREDGSFTILQFTDLHFGESDDADAATERLQELLINTTNSDLVVITGDLVSGDAWDHSQRDFFHSAWRKLTEPMLFTNTKYAITLGNHDSEADLSREEIMDLDMKHPLSLSQKGPEDLTGVANYLIQVHSRVNQSLPALNIWMMDSNIRSCGQVANSWGCPEQDQVNWFRQRSQEVKAQHGSGKHIDHIAFMHIPPIELKDLWNSEPVYGSKGEDVACPSMNTGFVAAGLEEGTLSGVFVGHDHNNDFGGWYQGIELAYGRKTGYSGYGNLKLGARVIKYKESMDARTGQYKLARTHYIMEEELSKIESETLFHRTERKQELCSSPQTFSEGSLLGEGAKHKYIMIAGILLAAAVIYCIYRRKMVNGGNVKLPETIAEGIKKGETVRILDARNFIVKGGSEGFASMHHHLHHTKKEGVHSNHHLNNNNNHHNDGTNGVVLNVEFGSHKNVDSEGNPVIANSKPKYGEEERKEDNDDQHHNHNHVHNNYENNIQNNDEESEQLSQDYGTPARQREEKFDKVFIANAVFDIQEEPSKSLEFFWQRFLFFPLFSFQKLIVLVLIVLKSKKFFFLQKAAEYAYIYILCQVHYKRQAGQRE